MNPLRSTWQNLRDRHPAYLVALGAGVLLVVALLVQIIQIVAADSPPSGNAWVTAGLTLLAVIGVGLALLPADTRKAMVAGLLAAASGVAVGELVGGIVTSAGSPVVAVGSFSIDNVPSGAKDFAIETFGTNDKRALIIGTLITLALIGMALGPLARRLPKVAAGIVGVVSLAGVLATVDQMNVAILTALWPSVIGAVAAVGVLLFLLRPPAALAFGGETRADVEEQAIPPVHDDDADPDELDSDKVLVTSGAPDAMPPRRQFLIAAGTTVILAGAVASTGRFLAGRNSAAASRQELVLPKPVEPLPPISDAVAINPPGVAPFTTPNPDFYRIDINLTTPQVKTEGYELTVKGMVEKELTISWEDIIDRDLNEYDITLTCVSNQIGGNLVGNARWLGFPLKELLDEAGVQDGADQVVGRSVDDYTGGFPLEAAYDRDAIVAIGMNGEPLPIIHGFPVRLVTPGIYGYLSAIKWLKEIEITTFDAFESYWVPRGYAEKAPIKVMSRIDTPRSFEDFPPGKVMVGGVAYAQTRGIEKVEVRIDEGEWAEATMGEALNKNTWRQWTYEWDATPGLHSIRSRATAGDGETQPMERKDPLPDGATGWHTVRVTIKE
ncbi:molybdopterin-dependent oxidoreductase [soil metagenome]